MASLTERLDGDYKAALKAGDRVRVDTLRLVKAAMQRVAIDKRQTSLGDAEVIQVLSQQAKQRRETIDAVKQTDRQDILDRATRELALLTAYLPQPLSAEALSQLIDEAIGAVGANQGAVMKYVMGKAAGAADGKAVSQLVSERLRRGAAA